MSYQVLARKWRPQSFDDVSGQAHVTTPLRNAIRTGRVPHAILLSGPRGVGKTTLARILARCLNCDKGPTVTPCGVCDNCRAIAAGIDTDVLEIDGASTRGIDDVRFLTNRSTGRMGYAVAAEAARRGHEVELVSGPTHLPPPPGVEFTGIRSARELLEACLQLWPGCQALVAAAAVSDYRPAERTPGKLKKSKGEQTLRLVSNPDVAAELGRRKRPGQVIVGFALEATHILQSRSSAEAKLADKVQDLTVLDGPAAMGAAEAEVSFFSPEKGWSEPAVLDKARVAERILDYLEARLGSREEADRRGGA